MTAITPSPGSRALISLRHRERRVAQTISKAPGGPPGSWGFSIHDLGDIGDIDRPGWEDLVKIGELDPPLLVELEHAWKEFLDGVEDLGGFIREHGINEIALEMLKEGGKDAAKEFVKDYGLGNPAVIQMTEIAFLTGALHVFLDRLPGLYDSLKQAKDKMSLPPDDDENQGPQGGGGPEPEPGGDAGSYGGGGSGGSGGPEPDEAPPPPSDDDRDDFDDDLDDAFPDPVDLKEQVEELRNTVAGNEDRLEGFEAELGEMDATLEQIEIWRKLITQSTTLQKKVKEISMDFAAAGS